MFRQAFSFVLATVLVMQAVPASGKSPKLGNPAEAKRRVEKLGVGQHVMVRTVQGRELHGHIVKIDAQTFALKPDHSSQTEIAYADVMKVRKNPGPIFWMLVGAVLVVIIIVVAAR